ncbi:MAG: PilT protein domain-containing protein [Alphaproteobacteria bacterium]|nr:MAG: PilT protein domain-containing protein [Caulobacteraceae bacterium]TPW07789.1 MAG: PilT protein domain-containing protein [Alphaproteobacteria bacterium]
MILIDSSVWIDHLRRAEKGVLALARDESMLTHPFIIGELALGSIKDRGAVIAALQKFPQAPVATDDEVLSLIETHALHGTGVGFVDAHLLAATLLAQATIWTSDKRLAAAARRLGVAAPMA